MGTEPIAEPDDELQTDHADRGEVALAGPPAKGNKWAVAVTLMAASVVVALLATQVLLLSSLNDAKTEIASLQGQIDAVGESVETLSDELSDVADTVEKVASSPVSASNASDADTQPPQSLPAGYLPRFVRNQPDAAAGMTLGTVEGIDAYSNEAVTVDPSDGTRRIWMVWAHWCPYCQQELPMLSDWYPEVDESYQTELVTVTTNIDPSRGNPLAEYLAASDFPFQVVIDEDSQLAVQLGVSAFPFWLITDGNGKVLLRTTGLLQIQQVENLFDQVEIYGT